MRDGKKFMVLAEKEELFFNVPKKVILGKHRKTNQAIACFIFCGERENPSYSILQMLKSCRTDSGIIENK